MSDTPTRAETRDSETVPDEGEDQVRVNPNSLGAPDPYDELTVLIGVARLSLFDAERADAEVNAFVAKRDAALFDMCWTAGDWLSRLYDVADTPDGHAMVDAFNRLCEDRNARGYYIETKLIDMIGRDSAGNSTLSPDRVSVYAGATAWFAFNSDTLGHNDKERDAWWLCPSAEHDEAIAAAREAGGIEQIADDFRRWALQHRQPGQFGALSKSEAKKAAKNAKGRDKASKGRAIKQAQLDAASAKRIASEARAAAAAAKKAGTGKASASGRQETVQGTPPAKPTSPAEAGVYTPQAASPTDIPTPFEEGIAAAGAHAKSVIRDRYAAARQHMIAEGTLSQESSGEDRDQVEKVAALALAFYAKEKISAKTEFDDDYPIQVWARIKNEATGEFELYGPMHDPMLCTAVLYQIAQENREDDDSGADDTAAA